MALTPSTMLPLGTPAPAFTLTDSVSLQDVSLGDFAGSPALLVMFICNHCPYVQHVKAELGRLSHDYISQGLAVVAINSNSLETHPQDGPAHMKELAAVEGWRFPYLFDQDQSVAKRPEGGDRSHACRGAGIPRPGPIRRVQYQVGAGRRARVRAGVMRDHGYSRADGTVESVERVTFRVEGTTEKVAGLWLLPKQPKLLYVMAHGAGAGMTHPFLETLAVRLARDGVACFRYQFPYMESGRRRPDPPHLLEATVRSAAATARRLGGKLPMIAGGKSMGGRMTSSALAQQDLPGVRALVFLGFPLHPPGRPGNNRAEHLYDIEVPMLFLQGSRDSFAHLDLLLPVCQRLGARATLHIVEGGDHSFKVLKRSGRTEEDVMDELAGAICNWSGDLLEL
jgi:predicted alpha/beta-hydrolase family hydrolase/peroxiredoxin